MVGYWTAAMLEQLQMGKSFVTKDLVWTVQEITGSMCELLWGDSIEK